MDIIQIIGLISGVLLFILSIYIGYIVIFQGNEGIRKASSIIDGFIDSGKVKNETIKSVPEGHKILIS